MKNTYIDTINSQAREATIRLYGSIGSKIDGDLFAQELASLDGYGLDLIRMPVNCPGGDVFQGMSIVSALMSMNTPVHVSVEGVAASMGAVIVVAADRVSMMDFAKMMIHDAYFGGVADSELTPKQRKMLARITEMLRQVLARRGKSEEEIAKLMKEETWFSAEEALAAGLVDEVTPSKKDYKALTPAQIVAAVEAEYQTKKDKQMKEIKLTAEATVALGITGEPDEQAVSAAIVTLGAKHKAEKERADALQAKLDAHTRAAATAMVEKAIAEGRIDATRKESFIALAQANPELAKATLEGIPARKPISDAVKGIQAGSGVVPAGREGWTRLEWLKKDPAGLAKIEAEYPDVFEAIKKVGK